MLVWTVFVTALSRAWWLGRLYSVGARSNWTQVFCMCLVLTLSGPEAERSVDSMFGGLPVALYVKHTALLVWFHLYLRILVALSPEHPLNRSAQHLLRLNLLLAALSFPWIAALPLSGRDVPRDVIIALRDLLLLTVTVTVFIPRTWALRMHEPARGTRVKLEMVAIGYSLLSLILAANVLVGYTAVTSQPFPPAVRALVMPTLSLGLVIIVLLSLPYRWQTLLFLPQRLWLRLRLIRLEARVLARVGAQDVVVVRPNLLRLSDVELDLYRMTINILDYGRLLELRPEHHALYQQIMAVQRAHPQYEALVHALAEVRLDD